MIAREVTSRIDALYATFYRRALWPAWESAIRKRPTIAQVAHLDATQWLPEEAIARTQRDDLVRLLTYAQREVPYYRELFARLRFDPRDVRRREDLRALPPLTKEIIRDRYDDLIAPAHRGNTIGKGTSGSTGAPLKFEYGLESEIWRNATRLRGYSWSGYRPGLPAFFYWAPPPVPPTGAKKLKIDIDRATRRETYVNPLHQDDRARKSAVDAIRRTRPHVIVAYAQACAQLARWIVETGARDWDDIPVICGAEPVLEADRVAMRRAFGPVFETYGARETMLIAAECSQHEGMHVSEENLLVEIAKGKEPLGAGEVGDVLVTDLHNYAMPFIRYANGDLAVYASRACSCGRGLRVLERVEGRRADTLRDAHGHEVPGILLHVLFADGRSEMIRQFQAVQRLDGAVLLKTVRGPGFSEPGFEQTVARLREHLRGLPVTVEFCDFIPPTASGKHRTVIVERPS
jgi:phenylacetate-CoA ligase